MTVAWYFTTCALSTALAYPMGADRSMVISPALAVQARFVGTALNSFTYDQPVLPFSSNRGSVFNIPVTGNCRATINGLNFGTRDLSQTVLIGASFCLTTSWSTSTAVTCTSAAGSGLGLGMRMTVASTGIASETTGLFSFDAAALTHVAPWNVPPSGLTSLTVHGMSFVNVDPSSTASFQGALCLTTAWMSTTSTSCLISPTPVARTTMQLRLFGATGTLVNYLSFDSPVITRFNVNNSPLTGWATVTITGSNFGAINPTLSAFIGGTSCFTASWLTASSFACAVQPGNDLAHTARVEMNGITTTLYAQFSYDAPVLTRLSAFNGPSTAGITATIEGTGFGVADPTLTIQLGSTVCSSSLWVSRTAAICQLPPGGDWRNRVAMTAGRMIGCQERAFTFDAPIATSALSCSLSVCTQKNLPSGGSAQLSIFGLRVWAWWALSKPLHIQLHIFVLCTAPRPIDLLCTF